jgi:predicted DNA-binding WGR domain protein
MATEIKTDGGTGTNQYKARGSAKLQTSLLAGQTPDLLGQLNPPPPASEVEPVIITELQYVDLRANHDKFYRVMAAGTELVTQYGRNGTYGTFGRKDMGTAAAAAQAAEKALAGKLGKGYKITASGAVQFDSVPQDSDLDKAARTLPAGSGPIAVAVPQEREQPPAVVAVNRVDDVDPEILGRVDAALEAIGLSRHPGQPPGSTRPMLAETIDPTQVEHMINSKQWVAQQKCDGDRLMIEVVDGQVSVLNRAGQAKTRNVGEDMVAPFRALTEGRWVFDGEVVGSKVWLFDMPASSHHDETAPNDERYRALSATLEAMGLAGSEHIGLIPTATSPEAKRALIESQREAGREGVIFRNRNAPYDSARRSYDLQKLKFLHEADVVVSRVNVGGKQNAELSVFDTHGNPQVVGYVTTIGKGSIAVGEVVEARFMGITNPDYPRMYQPRILRRRHDKGAAECSLEQFRYCRINKKVEDTELASTDVDADS